MTSQRQISRQDLRRLVIIKQHLADDEPPPLLPMIRDMGCVQLDPIGAVAPSHQLVLWSRTGKDTTQELDELRWESRELFEYWAHAASIVPTHDYPVHAWNMRQTKENNKRWQDWVQQREIEGLDTYILNQLRERGALFSREIEDDTARHDKDHRWWSGRHVPRVLQHLWTCGDVMVVGRSGKQRQWGLMEQFFTEETREIPAWTDEEITRYAAQMAVQALGAATAKQIKAHYTRSRYPGLKRVLDQLVAESILEQVKIVEDDTPLQGEWYLHSEDVPLLEQIQRGERQPTRTTLLSPFDNLICDRDRTEMLFDFYYRIEIYVPQDKREYGYYVLPILDGDQLIGRIDPKYDKKTRTLHVYNVYKEPTAPRNRRLVKRVQRAIEALADFRGAEKIEWGTVPEEWSALKA